MCPTAVATSEAPAQPAHPRSLIRVYTGRRASWNIHNASNKQTLYDGNILMCLHETVRNIAVESQNLVHVYSLVSNETCPYLTILLSGQWTFPTSSLVYFTCCACGSKSEEYLVNMHSIHDIVELIFPDCPRLR